MVLAARRIMSSLGWPFHRGYCFVLARETRLYTSTRVTTWGSSDGGEQ